MTTRIKHIGIMSQTPPRLFKFYECLFDFRTLRAIRPRSATAPRQPVIGYWHRGGSRVPLLEQL